MAEEYKVNTGVGMGMGETFQGTMGFVDPGENGIRDFNSVLKSLKEQNVSPNDDNFKQKLAEEMRKYETLAGAASFGTRTFKETTVEKHRFRKDKKLTTVKEEPYVRVQGELEYLATTVLGKGETELNKNFGPEATSYSEVGVRYFKWAVNNHNKNVENITKQALPEPYYNQVKEDARTAEEDAKRGINGRTGSRYWQETLDDFSKRRESLISQQNQTSQTQTQVETKKDEVQQTAEAPKKGDKAMVENQALEGMTQEEFNTYLDKLDKSFVEENHGIAVVAQQALTASGRQALDEKLKAFTENKTHQPTQNSQQAETPTAGSTPQAQAETPTPQQPQPQAQAEAPVAQQSQAQIDPKESEQQKIAADFKKLYGVDYTPENVDKLNKEGKIVTLNDAEKALTAKNASKELQGYSTEDLAKLQFAVRQAEFDSKYKEEPDKAIADRRKNIIENKDNMNDAILDKMERYASGTKKIKGGDYKSWKAEKDSFNMLQENIPEELNKHCKGTFEKANKKVNASRGAVSAERLAHANAQKLKYKSMEIKDTDGLWTMAKKTVKMKAFTTSRSVKKGVRKATGKVGKFFRGIYDNKYTRGISQRYSKIVNKVKLFPDRAKKAIGKFWKQKIADPAKKAWQEKVVTPYIDPAKKWVNDKVQWVKDNPKKAMAAAVMVASTGIGFAFGGPAGGLAGAKIGGMAVAGATLGYGAVKGAQWTYKKGVEYKDKAVNNAKESLKKSFEKNQEKIPNAKNNEDKEKANEEMQYAIGRQVYNQQPEEMKVLLDSYKKAISPEGNEGKPLTEKEAAVKMYQTMTEEKDKGGLGLSQESAQAVMTYFNGNKTIASKFEDIKDDINKPVSQEKPKEEERKIETPTNESKGDENKGAEQTTPQPQQTQQTQQVETPVAEQTAQTIPLNPEAKTAKAQARDDFKQLKSNSEFGDIMAYCQVKYAQGQKKLADDASKRIEKMITADKDHGGLGLDPEKDADRIDGLKSYLYKQGIKNDSFVKPKEKEKNKEQAQEGKIISMAAKKKQEEALRA